jgi:superfamily II DNA/RNA helicase
VCLIMGPSRELVRQIHEVVQEICTALAKDQHTRYPEIRAALITGALCRA